MMVLDRPAEATERWLGVELWGELDLSADQIVEALFFMLLIGASHRFSRALGVQGSCPVPSTIITSETTG